MCVILIGKTKDIRKVDLDSAWISNPHGAGIAYPRTNGKGVEVVKGIMDLDTLKGELKGIDPDIRIALHLRYATHGSIVESNTHPFKIGRSGSYLMHNGVLSAFGRSGDRGISDSMDLARVLGEIKDPRDRSKVLRSVSGMFCTISTEGIHTYGSRSWVKIRGSVIGSNDSFIQRSYSLPLHGGSRYVERSRYVWDE
ncbi:hypothetical protein EBZ39_07320 [bacterium]|nr:hypothetical protein [bacterium]